MTIQLTSHRTSVVDDSPRSLQVEWFVTTQHRGKHTDRSGFTTWGPSGTVHARRIGSPTTACGRGALDWQMFFDAPFHVLIPETCRDCVDVVQQSRAITRHLGRA